MKIKKTYEKNPKIQYDKALRVKKGTKNIWMRFKGVDCTTGTPDWDEAQIVVTRKRKELEEERIHGIKPLVSFDEAWKIYVADNEKHWSDSGKTFKNEKNMFDRMMGRAVKRRKGKGQAKLPPVYWTGLSVDCPSKITSGVMMNLYNTRIAEGSSISLANTEIAFIRRLIACMHTHGKRVPTLTSIKIKMATVKNGRLRIPLAREIKEICSKMVSHHADFVRCLALTGCRSQEMAAAKFGNIVWERGKMIKIWLEDTKNDELYSKPLVDQNGNQLDFGKIIERRYNARDKHSEYDWIFPMPKDANRHRDHSLEYWYRALNETKINSKAVRNLPYNNGEHLVPHHLRHFVGASLAAQGYSTAIIKRQLNQKDDRSAQIYTHRIQNTHEHETATVIDNLLKV